ncbi:MAG TPA: ATP-binding cassette domain-containing protein [Syntrophorhabdales bacterium]|nr:ATP-binding cassette domain-containing protein [Syntrophorhabdales bacterium]
MADLLVIDKLTKWFGNLAAVNDLSFNVQQGEILGMMGPNGAGKTTVFNLITGVHAPTAGKVTYQGRDVTHFSASHRCRLGIGRTYQIPRPFENMTVLENLLVGAEYGGQLKGKEARALCTEILDFTGLMPKKDLFAGKLLLLDRKRLELARGLATKPSLLLIDEVAAGLTEGEVERLLEIVKAIQKKGVTIVWVEHILMMMNKGVDRLLVINAGQSLMCGDPRECMESKEVQEVYLGAEEA